MASGRGLNKKTDTNLINLVSILSVNSGCLELRDFITAFASIEVQFALKHGEFLEVKQDFDFLLFWFSKLLG